MTCSFTNWIEAFRGNNIARAQQLLLETYSESAICSPELMEDAKKLDRVWTARKDAFAFTTFLLHVRQLLQSQHSDHKRNRADWIQARYAIHVTNVRAEEKFGKAVIKASLSCE